MNSFNFVLFYTCRGIWSIGSNWECDNKMGYYVLDIRWLYGK